MSETAYGVASPSSWMPRRLSSDARLARLAGRGDQRAFEAIFERFHQELYRYCRALLRDPDDAQDALQSTMASALRSLPGDERQISLRPWLYRVAHNEAISILRQRANTVESDRLPEPTVPGADAEAEARERLRVLVADLDELPERQRGALVMRELNGLSYAEIGAALTASEAAARQTVYEARVALRDLDLGRAMDCDAARHALSERDGRMLRSRRLRAHLRACEPCSDFGAAISQRRSDLGALCPPLPAIAASGLLTTVLGGTGTGGVGAAGGALAGGAGVASGAAAGAPLAVKAASVAVAVVIGAGAAEMSGVVKLPVVGGWGAEATPNNSPSAGHPGGESPSSANARSGDAPSAGTRPGDGGPQDQRAGGGRGHAGGANQSAGEAPSSVPAGTLPATSNGTPPAHSSAGGNSQAHGHSGGKAASQGKPASPPGLDNAESNAPELPPQARGKPGSPPGHSDTAPGYSRTLPGQNDAISPKALGGSAADTKPK